MRLRVLFLVLFLLTALPGVAQEQEAAEDQADSVAEEEPAGRDSDDAGETPEEDEVDDSDLDLQTYEEPEDIFVPTEEIPSDQPIPFPSNI